MQFRSLPQPLRRRGVNNLEKTKNNRRKKFKTKWFSKPSPLGGIRRGL
jgi:hypothetical protein